MALILKSRSRAFYVIRIITILATAMFWVAAARVYGLQATIIGGAVWMMFLAAHDLTAVLVRGVGARHAKKALTVDGLVMAARLSLMLLLIYVLNNAGPAMSAAAAGLQLMLFCVPLRAREAVRLWTRTAHVGGAGVLSVFARHGGGVLLLLWQMTGPKPAPEDLFWIFIIREAISLAFMIGAALLGAAGLARIEGGEEDEDGDELFVDLPALGERFTETHAWVHHNLTLSRKKWVKFASRNMASSMFGPFGNIGVRLAFLFENPQKSAARKQALPPHWGRALKFIWAALLIGVVAYAGVRHGVGHALGITTIAFVARVGALSINAAGWFWAMTLLRRRDGLV